MTVRSGSPPAYPRGAAIIAGVTTILMAFLGIFAAGMTSGLLDDAGAAAERVADDHVIIRLSAVAFVLVAILDVVLAWALARYYGAVQPELSRLAAWLRISYAAVLAVAAGILATAVRLATEPDTLDVAASVHAALVGYNLVWLAGLTVFAAHLLVLALILLRDPATPSVFGVLIGLAGVGYASDSIIRFMVSTDAAILSVMIFVVAVLSVVGEIGFAIWLLVRGGKSY